MTFPVSGVETAPWIPPLVACVISFFTSMGGVSGAFLILPFQMSVLGFVSPAVTPTNLIFNIIGIPGAIYRFTLEGRMAWPLALNIIVGTLPGVFIGAVVRIVYLPDPRDFKFFAGLVLLYIGARMLFQAFRGERPEDVAAGTAEERMRESMARGIEMDTASREGPVVRTLSWSISRTEYEFCGERFGFNTTALFLLSLAVGLVGGVYGIGGGAIIAPFLVAFFRLPIHTIAGAALMGTCVTSVFGVVFYVLVAPHYAPPGVAIAPDWLLGVLFGIGGIAGMYMGARAQKHVPGYMIRPLLGLLITGLALRYVCGYFL